MSKKFNLVSNYKPAGDQPRAIDEIVKGLNDGLLNQTLLGVLGQERHLLWQMLSKRYKGLP